MNPRYIAYLLINQTNKWGKGCQSYSTRNESGFKTPVYEKSTCNSDSLSLTDPVHDL